MAKRKMTREEENALRINAMIQGIPFEEMVKSMQAETESESAAGTESDIEFEDEADEKLKKKATKGRKKSDKPLTTQQVVPELKQFENINRDMKLNVSFNEHFIPYKEQQWPVPSRTLEYLVEIVSNPKIARDLADLFSKGSAEERVKAENGTARYFKVVNYQDNVSYKIREIAYIKVTEKDGKLHTQLYIKNKLLKENNANPERIKKNLNRIMKDMVA